MSLSDELHALKTDHRLVMEKLASLRSEVATDIAQLTSSLENLTKKQLEELLHTANPNVRATALSVLDRKEGSKNLVNTCKTLAISDSDADVRGMAVLILGDAFVN